jgi:hypothetical protein
MKRPTGLQPPLPPIGRSELLNRRLDELALLGATLLTLLVSERSATVSGHRGPPWLVAPPGAGPFPDRSAARQGCQNQEGTARPRPLRVWTVPLNPPDLPTRPGPNLQRNPADRGNPPAIRLCLKADQGVAGRADKPNDTALVANKHHTHQSPQPAISSPYG